MQMFARTQMKLFNSVWQQYSVQHYYWDDEHGVLQHKYDQWAKYVWTWTCVKLWGGEYDTWYCYRLIVWSLKIRYNNLFYRIWDMLSSSLCWASATGQNLSRGGYHHHGSWFPGKGNSVFILLFHYFIILCQWLSVIPGHKRIQISWEENIHAEHGLVSL